MHRAKKLGELREEYEKYSNLASIEAEKAAALIGQLEQTVGKSRARERWIGFLINIAAGILIFLAGVWAHDPVKQFFSWIAAVLSGSE